MSSSSTTTSRAPKRKAVEEIVGGHVLSAAVGDVVARTMSAAVRRHDALASVDDQLDRLATLLVMVHAAVDEAGRVHAAGPWLRRWLWRLRYAALDGDEVLRSMRQQRGADAEAATATGQSTGGRLWNAAARAVRSAKSMLVSAAGGGDDGGVERLSRTVATLEQACAGLGDFLRLLELEIQRSLAPPAPPSAPAETRGCRSACNRKESSVVSVVGSSQQKLVDTISLDDDEEGSEAERFEEHDVDLSRYFTISQHEHISRAEYIGCTVAIGLQIVTRKIQRAAGKLTTMPPEPETDTDRGDSDDFPAALPPAADDTASRSRLRGMVADIREAVELGDRAEVNAERRWLAEWRRELQAVADRADRVLGVGDGGGDDDDEQVRRTVRSLETAAAHLSAYVTLLRFAVVVVGST